MRFIHFITAFFFVSIRDCTSTHQISRDLLTQIKNKILLNQIKNKLKEFIERKKSTDVERNISSRPSTTVRITDPQLRNRYADIRWRGEGLSIDDPLYIEYMSI